METQAPAQPALTALPAQFEDMRNRLFAMAESIPESLYNRKPADGGWSPAQVMQHLLLSAQGIVKMQENGRTAPTQRDPARQYGILDKIFKDYEAKYESAPNLLPNGDHFDKSTQLAAMKDALDHLQHQLREPGLTDELVEFDVPAFGIMTRMEFIYLVVVHTNRHVRQMKAAIAA